MGSTPHFLGGHRVVGASIMAIMARTACTITFAMANTFEIVVGSMLMLATMTNNTPALCTKGSAANVVLYEGSYPRGTYHVIFLS